jgi:putative hydrolase of HD superfamily
MGGYMKIRKGLILKLFSGANIQRWNDKIRPTELTELDKQAHKMIIAYVLGKYEEKESDVNWIDIIEGGIFEYLQRIEITDIKPPIFYQIKENKEQYEDLKKWVYKRLNPVITPLGQGFKNRYNIYFSNNEQSISRRIISAAHAYATNWEFDLIEPLNLPKDIEIPEIRKSLIDEQRKYEDLQGMQELQNNPSLKTFIDLCGQLRFQLRWSHVRRLTHTSVLGHMLIVAILAYLFSTQTDACPKRRINNYFTGLFHDLPEALTRDIISPVKGAVEGISEIIKEYEKEQMKSKIYRIIPNEWHPEIKMYAEDEFADFATINGTQTQVTSKMIKEKYNDDVFNPRDGTLIKACDDLAAFTEAYIAICNGATAEGLQEAKYEIKKKYKNKYAAGIAFGPIYADFE